MLIKTLPVGHLETNCYVVTDENTLECAVIDPGAESNTILGYIEDNHLKCRAVMLTHAHFDHVGALGAVMKETGARCYVNRREEGTGVTGLRDFRPPEDSVFYGEGDTVQVGSLTFRVMETPGHTPGGVTLMGGIDASIVDREDSTEEEIRKEVRRACTQYGPGGHYIPCITYGGPGCLYPHVDPIIDDEIEKYNKEVYGI